MTLTDVFKKMAAVIRSVTKPIFDFLNEHWVSVGVVLLGLVIFALVTALLIFTWPAFIGTVAGITVTLPIIGTIAPMLFLSALSVPAAATVLGLFAFAGFIVGSALLAGSIYVLNYVYSKLDNWFTSELPNEERARALNDAKADLNNAMNEIYRAGYLAASNNFHKKQVIDFMKQDIIEGNSEHFDSPLGKGSFISPSSKRSRLHNPLNPMDDQDGQELDVLGRDVNVSNFFEESSGKDVYGIV